VVEVLGVEEKYSDGWWEREKRLDKVRSRYEERNYDSVMNGVRNKWLVESWENRRSGSGRLWFKKN